VQHFIATLVKFHLSDSQPIGYECNFRWHHVFFIESECVKSTR
jgi:hypothetical protein